MAARVKVIDLAKELGVTSKDLIVALESMGQKGMRAMSPLQTTTANELRVKLGRGRDLPEEAKPKRVPKAKPAVTEPKGPGSGYGVRKAAAGALQHLDFAAKAEGASANVKTHAVHVSASLTDAIQWTADARAASVQRGGSPRSRPLGRSARRLARCDARPSFAG